jgi:hypothetical protein
MPRYSYTIPRDTKGEGKILMIFSRKSFIWTLAAAGVGLCTIYLICLFLNVPLIGIIGVLIFALVGFLVSSVKMPNSTNFEILRKTGGEDVDEIIKRLIKFKMKKKKIYLYYTGGKENE